MLGFSPASCAAGSTCGDVSIMVLPFRSVPAVVKRPFELCTSRRCLQSKLSMRPEMSKRRQNGACASGDTEISQPNFIFDVVLTFITINSSMVLAFFGTIDSLRHSPRSEFRGSESVEACAGCKLQERGVRIKSQAG